MMTSRSVYKSLAMLTMIGAVMASTQTGAIAATGTVKESSASVVAPVASPSRAEVGKMAADLAAAYVNTQVVRGPATTVVTFADRAGKSYHYEFATSSVQAARATGTVTPFYNTTWTGWDLNRRETRELITDGSNAAIIYAIGVALGCVPCALGAFVENNWSGRAAAAYNAGHCLHINYWMTTNEYSGGACK
jgi:hypothetical protein